MKKILIRALVAGAGVIGLVACDPDPPAAPPAVVETETVPPVAEVAEPIDVDAEAVAAMRASIAEAIWDEDAYSRAQRLGMLLPTIGPETVPAVIETLGDRTLNLGGLEIELLVRTWATHRPEEASRWAVTQSPAGFKIGAILNSLTVWAEADPVGAMTAVQQSAQTWASYGPAVYETVQAAVVRGWYAAGHSDLKPFIRQIGPGVGRQRALATFVRALVQNEGPEAAIRWAESLPDSDPVFKTSVYRRVATVLARFDRDATIRWCEAHCEGPFGDNLRSIIASQWVRNSDGATTLEWLGSQAPKSHQTDLAVRFTFADWGMLDRPAVMAWMAEKVAENNELEPWLRPVIPVYARFLAHESPIEAIEWAEKVDHEVAREGALVRVAQIWIKNDPEAAESWLSGSSLSHEARDRARGKTAAQPSPTAPPADERAGEMGAEESIPE